MGSLVRGDLLEIAVEGRVVTGCCEVRLGEVGEGFPVELVLEMLEGQRVVENVGVGDLRSCLAECKQAVPKVRKGIGLLEYLE